MYKPMPFAKQCNPQTLAAELQAADVLVETIQSTPDTTIVVADEQDEPIVASCVAAHVYEPITLGRSRLRAG